MAGAVNRTISLLSMLAPNFGSNLKSALYSYVNDLRVKVSPTGLFTYPTWSWSAASPVR